MSIGDIKILIIGFGTVGQGFFELFNEKKKKLSLENVVISEIVDKKYGYIKNPSPNVIDEIRGGKKFPEREVIDVIKESDADVVCEFTWVDFKTGEPAFSHIKTALENGKHVITTNKGPVALKYSKLVDIAESKGVKFRFKGTVMAGTPSFNLLDLIPGANVKSVRGIMNGTTNYMLAEMAKGKTFEEALKQAQELGYAEADPTNDVDGFDAASKAVIVSNLLGWNHSIETMKIEGIRKVTPEEAGHRMKLIAYADCKEIYVKPVALSEQDPLGGVNGVMNAIEFDTDTLGKIYVMGPGAGRIETAQAAITDLADILE